MKKIILITFLQILCFSTTFAGEDINDTKPSEYTPEIDYITPEGKTVYETADHRNKRISQEKYEARQNKLRESIRK